jgi:hypothetical protein
VVGVLLFAAGVGPASADETVGAAGLDLGPAYSDVTTPRGDAFPFMPLLGAHCEIATGAAFTGVATAGAHDWVFGRSETFSSVYSGVRSSPDPWYFDAAVRLGAHTVAGLGPVPAGMPQAPMNVLVFAGLQLGLGKDVPSGSRWGVSIFIDRDLTRGSAVVEPTSCGILDCSGSAETHRVGGTTIGLSLRYEYVFYRR